MAADQAGLFLATVANQNVEVVQRGPVIGLEVEWKDGALTVTRVARWQHGGRARARETCCGGSVTTRSMTACGSWSLAEVSETGGDEKPESLPLVARGDEERTVRIPGPP